MKETKALSYPLRALIRLNRSPGYYRSSLDVKPKLLNRSSSVSFQILAPLDLSTVKSDETEPKPEYSVEEMVAMELSKSREEIHRDLVEMCFRGVELCLKRFPTHYKSHYRLAYIYVHSPYHKVI